MSAIVHFRLGSICMNALHTICVIGVSALPFIFESVYKHEFKFFDVWPLNWKSLYLLLSIASLFLYYIASFKDPGYVLLPKNCTSENSEDEEDEMRANEDSNMLERGFKLRHCGFCGIKQPLRARHCETCGRCVRRFDHHCPWLGNCVGEGNHRYFILFVVTSAIGLIWSAYLVWKSKDSGTTPINPYTDNLRWVSIIALLFLSLPLGALSVVHIYLTFSNVTAWEFLSRHRISYLKNLEDLEANPFHLGCCRNGFVVLCSRSYQSWEKVYHRFLMRGHRRQSGFEC